MIFGLDKGRTCSYCQMVIPEFILPPQSFCQPLKRLPWRQYRGGEGSPDTEQNLVIGRLSEDRGYCSPTEGSEYSTITNSTHSQIIIYHTIPLSGGGKNNKGGISAIHSAKCREEKIAGHQPLRLSPIIA